MKINPKNCIVDDDDAWYIRIKRGVMKKRRFKLPKLMRDLDDEDEDDEQGMDGKVSRPRLGYLTLVQS